MEFESVDSCNEVAAEINIFRSPPRQSIRQSIRENELKRKFSQEVIIHKVFENHRQSESFSSSIWSNENGFQRNNNDSVFDSTFNLL